MFEIDAETQLGLGTFCLPGVVVAVEKLMDRLGFVVLWHDTDEKAAKEVYSSEKGKNGTGSTTVINNEQ